MFHDKSTNTNVGETTFFQTLKTRISTEICFAGESLSEIFRRYKSEYFLGTNSEFSGIDRKKKIVVQNSSTKETLTLW